MDIPVIETPIFPRWVWMEEITYSHIPIATIITAYMVLAPLFEYIGWRRKDPRFDRLAKGWIWFAMILFSPGAALGTGIPIFIIGTYPEFWSRWSNLFFWPLIVQFCFFLAEVGFLFFGYYLSWDRWMNRKALHITMGAIAAAWGLCVQIVWDALGAYMLTPGGAALPAVKQPVGWSAAAFFNPSFPFLFSHRFVGNISYVMLLTGGVLALRHLRNKDPQERDYFRWASNLCFTVGFLAFFGMPVIGWFYARVIQAEAPVAFHALMGGHQATTFTAKFILIGLFLLLGGLYLFVRYRTGPLRIVMTIGLAALLIVVFVHPPLKWLGDSPVVWRASASAVIVAAIALMWLLGGRGSAEWKGWRVAMFVAGLAAFFAFCFGGFVREASKNPDTVYGQLVKPEVLPEEADRYLTYDKCLRCHADTGPKLFERHAGSDWAAIVQAKRRLPNAPPITDEQARRITRFLKERY